MPLMYQYDVTAMIVKLSFSKDFAIKDEKKPSYFMCVIKLFLSQRKVNYLVNILATRTQRNAAHIIDQSFTCGSPSVDRTSRL